MTGWMRRAGSRLQLSPALTVAGVVLFVIVTSAAPWAKAHAAEITGIARDTGAVLLVITGCALVFLAARAVSERTTPARHHREGVDLSHLPARVRAPGYAHGYDDAPEPAPAVFPGKIAVAAPEPESRPAGVQAVEVTE